MDAIPLVLLCGLALAAPLAAEITTYTIGEQDDWRAITQYENIVRVSGKRGYTDLTVAEATPLSPRDNNLVLTFDQPDQLVQSAYYRVHPPATPSVPVLRGKPYYGAASGLFNYGSSIAIETLAGSVFSPAENGNGFSIQFFLYGRSIANYDRLFSWETAATGAPAQSIALQVAAGRTTWQVHNLLFDASGSGQSFTLTSATPLTPRQWQHHLLSYDSASGALQYYIDGILHDAHYATDSADESGAPFTKQITHPRGTLTVGEHFSGALDHFLVSTISGAPAASAPNSAARYVDADAVASSDIIDLTDQSGRIIDIRYEAETTTHGEVVVMYRAFSAPAELRARGDVGWRRAYNGVALPTALYARYIQFRLLLRADQLHHRAPRLSSITIRLEQLPAPQPARAIVAIPRSGGRIDVRWEHPVDLYPTRYRVLYGTTPQDLTERIDVGSDTAVVLDALIENALYYIRVDSYRGEIATFRNARSALISSRAGDSVTARGISSGVERLVRNQ